MDIFIVACPEAVSFYNKSTAPIYEKHDTIELRLNIYKPKIPIHTFFIRDFSNFNSQNFNRLVLDNLNNTPANSTINEQCTSFTNTITNLLDEHAPLKPIKTTNKRKPWLSREIRKIMHQRDNVYKRAKAANSVSIFNFYKHLRSKVKNLLDSAKNRFLATKISESKNSKELWKTFRSFGIAVSSKPNPLKMFTSNQLNDHFTSVSSHQPSITFSDLNSILNNKLSPLSPVFKFSTIQHDDLLKVINRVKSKAKGYDRLSSDHLSLVVSAISGFPLKLFNKSLSLGEFPEPWKKNSYLCTL